MHKPRRQRHLKNVELFSHCGRAWWRVSDATAPSSHVPKSLTAWIRHGRHRRTAQAAAIAFVMIRTVWYGTCRMSNTSISTGNQRLMWHTVKVVNGWRSDPADQFEVSWNLLWTDLLFAKEKLGCLSSLTARIIIIFILFYIFNKQKMICCDK